MTDIDFDQTTTPAGVVTFNEVPDISDGIYDAVVESVNNSMGKDFETGEPQPQLEWLFAVDGDHGGVELRGWTTLSKGTKANLRLWLQALLGAEVMNTPNLEVDFQHDVVGQACMVEVAHNQKGQPKVVRVLPKRKR